MPQRWLVVALALTLLTAGCLSGDADPTPDASEGQPSPQDAPGGANETTKEDGGEDDTDDASQDGDDEASEGNETNEGDREETSEGTEEDEAGWPSPEDASIRPGVRIQAEGQCTSNFLFRTPDNASLMLGVAAHCVADKPNGVSGCSDEVEPLEPGAKVEIEGASQPGVLRYSSYHTMQEEGTSDEDACWSNDFALVEIDPADRARVHPAVRGIGGPTSQAGADAIDVGDEVRWYGATSLTPQGEATSHHEGYVVSSGDWRFQTYSVAPGLPGDSGSGLMLADGSAAGVLVSVQLVYPGANGIMKLEPALVFAHEHGVEAQLVTWPALDG